MTEMVKIPKMKMHLNKRDDGTIKILMKPILEIFHDNYKRGDIDTTELNLFMTHYKSRRDTTIKNRLSTFDITYNHTRKLLPYIDALLSSKSLPIERFIKVEEISERFYLQSPKVGKRRRPIIKYEIYTVKKNIISFLTQIDKKLLPSVMYDYTRRRYIDIGLFIKEFAHFMHDADSFEEDAIDFSDALDNWTSSLLRMDSKNFMEELSKPKGNKDLYKKVMGDKNVG